MSRFTPIDVDHIRSHLPRAGRLASRPFRGIIVAAFICALIASPALAQSTNDGDAGATFGESVDVRLVNLEVVVEEDGERIEGLEARDFVLLVDGERVPIEFFREVRGGRLAAATASSPADELTPGTSASAEAVV